MIVLLKVAHLQKKRRTCRAVSRIGRQIDSLLRLLLMATQSQFELNVASSLIDYSQYGLYIL
jgi:hypothetical protein